MAMNYEFDRHILAASQAGDDRAVEIFTAQKTIFNSLLGSEIIFELPREQSFVSHIIPTPDSRAFENLPQSNPEDWGRRLKHYRKLANLSQEDVSKTLFVTTALISNYEHGRYIPKHIGRLIDLAQVVSVPLEGEPEFFALANFPWETVQIEKTRRYIAELQKNK